MALDRSITDALDSRGPARVLSPGRIVFLVIAAAAPMAGMVGNVPLALALGNGPAMPAAYLIAGLSLLDSRLGGPA